MAFLPYLYFGGNCREAFSRYEEIFGGDLTLLPMSDFPDGETPPEHADLIMHAALKIGDDLLMASDDPAPGFGPVQGMQVSYSTRTVEEAERVFKELCEGGTVMVDMAEVFWAPRFGICTDRFGTPWMVSADPVADA